LNYPASSRRVWKVPSPYLAQNFILSLLVPLKVVTGANKTAWLIFEVKYYGFKAAPAKREVVP